MPKLDRSEHATKLLDESLANVQLKDMFLDYDSINFDKLHEIVRKNCYDSAVDAEVIWEQIFYASIRFSDTKNKGKTPLTDEQRCKLVKLVHDNLSRIPIRYEVLFELPESYPLNNKSLLDDVRIERLAQTTRKLYEAQNPPDFLQQLAHPNASYENPVLPKTNVSYLAVADSGLIRPGGKIVLDNRHDPVRIFRLYMALQMVSSNLSQHTMRQHDFTARAYDKKKFVAYIPTRIDASSPISHACFNKEDRDKIELIDKLFGQILKVRDDDLEDTRIRLSNALHWYFEFASSDDTSLRVVYLVSAFDSLFGFIEKDHIPTARDIVPIIAEANANDFKERSNIAEAIKQLYRLRNNIIHGRKEIQNYTRSDARQKRHVASNLDFSERQFKQYMGKLLRMYIKTPGKALDKPI